MSSATHPESGDLNKVITKKKSIKIAYALWLVMGFIGAHNFYIRRYSLACIEVALVICGYIAEFSKAEPLGELPWYGALWGILWISDCFTIPSAIKKDFEKQKKYLLNQSNSYKLSKKEKVINFIIILCGIFAGIITSVQHNNSSVEPELKQELNKKEIISNGAGKEPLEKFELPKNNERTPQLVDKSVVKKSEPINPFNDNSLLFRKN